MNDRSDIIELQASIEVPAVGRNFRCRGAFQDQLGKRLLNELVVREAMEFVDQIADDELYGTDIYRARIRVVAPDAEAWLVERQGEVAKQVVERAIASIRQWGSDYGETHVSKERAVEDIRRALAEVTK